MFVTLHWKTKTGILVWHVDENKKNNREEGYPGMEKDYDGLDKPWPANNMHYKVALLGADGNYDLEKIKNNKGDAGDVHRPCAKDSIVPGGSFPNTDSYQADIKKSDVTIKNIRKGAGQDMVFDLCLGACASGTYTPNYTCCKDVDGWTVANASYGGQPITCEVVVKNYGWCEDPTNADAKGVKATQACCGCKEDLVIASGGSTPVASPTNPPVASPTNPPASCTDDASFTDSYGWSCKDYAKAEGSCADAATYAVGGKDASTACCVCKK